MSMQDYEREMETKACGVCNREDVSEAEIDEVDEYLGLVPFSEFESIIEAMGVSDQWETVVICKDCLDYYKE